MKSINLNHSAEDELFDKWREESVKNGDGDMLSSDGLLYRGKFVYSNDGYWSRVPGNEDVLWQRTCKRIAFLVKDANNDEECDVRSWTGRKNHSGSDCIVINTPFYKNVMRWTYGILNIGADSLMPDFEYVDNQEVYLPFFENTPIAQIECKKQVGKGSVSNCKLTHFMEKYKKFLIEQLQMIDAEILLCCGGQSRIKDFVQKYYLPDLVKVNDWIYFSPSSNKVVIDCYHPSCRKAHKMLYDEIKHNYEDFISKYPHFIN